MIKTGDIKCTSAINPKNNPSRLLRKLVELMQNPISADFFERQFDIFGKYLKYSTYAIYVRDLPYVIRLLDLLLLKIEKYPQFREPLETLLMLTATPPILTKSSEVLEFRRDLEEYFSTLGYLLLCFNEKRFHYAIVNSIIDLLKRPKKPLEIYCLSLRTTLECIECSQLPGVIGQLLGVVDEEIFMKLLEITSFLIKNSRKACQILIEEDAINFLLKRLEPTWNERDCATSPPHPTVDSILLNYEEITEILWIMLNFLDGIISEEGVKENIKNPQRCALWSWHYAFKLMIIKENETDRNNLLAILLKLFSLFEEMEFQQSGIAEDLATLSIATETDLGESWISQNIKMTFTETDCQFKKMLLLCLPFFIDYNAVKYLKDKNVVRGLLQLFENDQSMPWDKEQFCQLLAMELRILPKLFPALVEDFLSNNGPELMLGLSQRLLDAGDITTLEIYLHALSQIILENDGVSIAIQKSISGGISQLISICDYILCYETLTQATQNCLLSAFCILGQLFIKYDVVIIDKSLVDMLIIYFKRLLNPHESDAVHDPKVTISAIDLLWESIAQSNEKLKEFALYGGIYAMLDIIQNCTWPVKLIALTVLIDICEKPTCIPYVITWRGEGQRVTSLLLKLFKEDNLKLKETKNKKQKMSSTTTITALADLMASCQPKVHALIQLLTVQHEEVVEIADEHYKMFNECLTADEQATLIQAENYMALKLGEMWKELGKEIEKTGVELVDDDKQVLSTMIQCDGKLQLNLINAKNDFIKVEKSREKIDELTFYNKLREMRLSQALEALGKIKMSALCSERMFQVRKKLRQNKQVDWYMEFYGAKVSYHKTFMRSVGVSNVFNQTVSVVTDTLPPEEEEEVNLPSISSTPEESEVRHWYCSADCNYFHQ